MAINLSTTSSITDYLSTLGKDSSFSARKSLYDSLGLNSRLGDYVGSSAQNTNFLNTLRTQASASSTPIPQTTSSSIKPATSALTTAQNTQSPYAALQSQLEQAKTQALNIKSNLESLTSKGYGQTDISALPQKTDIANLPQNTNTPTSAPATDALSTLFGMPTSEQVASDVENDPAYKLYKESLENKSLSDKAKAEADKVALSQKYEADKTKLEQNLSERGLAFSGIRSQDVKSLTDALASSTLSVDRELASTLLDRDTSLKGKFLDLAGDVVKKATDANKSAIEQLNKAGYAVINGTLVPTLESQKTGKLDVTTNVVTQGGKKYVIGIDKNTGEQLWKTEAGDAATKNRVVFRDIGGQVTQLIYDGDGNIVSQTPLGLSSSSSNQVREAISTFATADSMLDTIENLAKRVITATKTSEIPEQYITENLDALLKSKPDAAVYLNTYKSFASMLARAAGQVGVLTQQDVDTIINTLPKLSDTVDVMNGKLQVMRGLYESIKVGKIQAYSQTIPTTTQPTSGKTDVTLSDLNFKF